MKSPCCNAKPTKGKGKLLRCPKCNGQFDPVEIASGRIEGGTAGTRPDERILREEAGDHERGYVIKSQRKLKGGL